MYTPAFIEKKIGSEKIGFHFGMGSFNLFCEIRGIELNDLEKEFAKNQMSGIADMLFCAYKFNLLRRDLEVKHNRFNAYDWLDQMSEKDLNDIMKVFSKAQVLGKKLNGEDESAKDVKK